MKNEKYFYEKIVFLPKIPHWLFSVLLSAISFYLSQILVTIDGQNSDNLLIPRILISAYACVVPVVLTWGFYNFQKSAIKFIDFLPEKDHLEFRQWISTRAQRIFSFQSWLVRLVVFAGMVGALFTVFYNGFIFSTTTLNLIAVAGTIVTSFLACHAAYILIDLMVTAYDLTNWHFKMPFYHSSQPTISELYNYFMIIVFWTIVGYILLVGSMWLIPSLQTRFIGWITIATFYPLALFIWTLLQFHAILVNTKRQNMEIIGKEIEIALSELQTSKKKESIERLEKLMSVQENLRKMSEWSFSVQGFFTFLLSSGLAIVQTVISILRP
ncbi:MAG: hypothetical protein J0M11_18640 [Anaerolineae bacterium]|nr:hypothetical protein [Anaerolineae bacterium]